MTESLSRHTRPESWKLPRRPWAAKDDGCLLDPQTGDTPVDRSGGSLRSPGPDSGGSAATAAWRPRPPSTSGCGCGPDIALYIAGFENVRIRKVCI